MSRKNANIASMTVSQLAKDLSKYPDDMRIIVSGYEGGFSDVSMLTCEKILINVNKPDYYGPHELAVHAKPDETALYFNAECPKWQNSY